MEIPHTPTRWYPSTLRRVAARPTYSSGTWLIACGRPGWFQYARARPVIPASAYARATILGRSYVPSLPPTKMRTLPG